MSIRMDFLDKLGPDLSTVVFTLLTDPTDIVRVSAVNRAWRDFVILKSFCKKLCLRTSAGVSCFTDIEEETTSDEFGSKNAMKCTTLVQEHKVFSRLSYYLLKLSGNGDCIGKAIRASTSDMFGRSPFEHIKFTLIMRPQPLYRLFCWSSKGKSDASVPETLIYQLGSKLCVVNEIKVQPFPAYGEEGSPVYSARAVRFRMGHCSSGSHKFVWTYVSPEFPMVQQNNLQAFKLPQPTLCVGGFVQIEMLGPVQVRKSDNLYYIRVGCVQVIGRPLTPTFDVDIDEAFGRSTLNYFPEKVCESSFTFSKRMTRLREQNYPNIII